MLRICFNRKNRTLGKLFSTKAVLQMLESNYKIVAEQRDAPDKESSSADLRAGIRKVLVARGLEDRARPAKLTIHDFLELLHEFNRQGWHFAA